MAGLSTRIMKAASNIRLFSTVKHLTAADALGNIFDGCLYGRKNLQDLGIKFRPASFYASCDIRYGDSNSICFGPQYIDPQSLKDNTAEIIFDANALIKQQILVYFLNNVILVFV